MTRNSSAKKSCAFCALCLLLCTALLAACTPGAPGVPGSSGTLNASGISGVADPGAPGTGTSGTDPSLSGASGSGAGTPLSDANDIPTHGKEAPVVDLPALPADTASSLDDGEDICRLPLAPDTGTEFPEPDRAAVLADGIVALHLDAREFVLGTDDAVGYPIENTTGQSVGVSFAPRLERWTNGAWEWIPSDIGFCGTPDPIGETCSDSLRLDWFSGLTEGVYRLTYTLGFTMTEDPDGHIVISENHPFSACFHLRDP